MDTTKTVTHISLCAGYGGIDLGLKRAVPHLRTVAFSEIEAFACANLVAKMEAGFLDPAPIWSNLKTFPWASFHGKVDILSGGYPCQPFSSAGKRLGAEDPRHLWPFIADGIARMQPRVCFFENVEGHLSLGLENVLQELQRLGYRCTFGIFSAAEVGAPHQRKRVFILAHRSGAGLEGLCGHGHGGDEPGWLTKDAHGSTGAGGVCCWPSRPRQPQHAWEPPRTVANGHHIGLPDASDQQRTDRTDGDAIVGTRLAESRRGQAQPSLGRDADGSAHRMDDAELYVSCDNRTDELRLLGNGVVPATAERAFRVLIKRLIP